MLKVHFLHHHIFTSPYRISPQHYINFYMKFTGNHELNKLNKAQWPLSLLLIASPWILLFVTTGLIAHHSVFNSVPCWSDELAYWHEVLSFSQKGLDFGYYSMNEVLPAYFSFGTHGFGTVSLYALFGKIFGWKTYSLVIANSFFMSLAFLLLTTLMKVSTKNLIIILFLTLTYIPLILFSPTSMSELLNLSMLIVYVVLLHVYFQRGGKKWLLIVLLFCTAISFVRIIYIVLFLPVLFKRKDGFKFDCKFLIYVVLWIVFSGLLFAVNILVVSPYPGSFLTELFKSDGVSDFVRNFAIHFGENAWNFINPVSDTLIQVLQRYLELTVCLICLWKSRILQTKFKTIVIDYFIVFLMLFFFLLINIAAYDVFDWRDYRVLAPVLYGCILLLILNNKMTVAYSLLVFNLIGVTVLFLSPQVLESFNKGRYIKPVVNTMLNRLEYTVNPVSRFENTIVVQQFNANTVLNIPAGIGITYSDALSDKLRSKYIYTGRKLDLLTYNLKDSCETGYLYQEITPSLSR